MDLTTQYLGLNLKNPLIASSSPLTSTVNSIRNLEKAGIAAVVLPSLFEEAIRYEQNAAEQAPRSGNDLFTEANTFLPSGLTLERGAEAYLEMIQRAKDAVTIPVIASLNGCTNGGWVDYAQKIEKSGADAIELHIYYNPPSLDITSQEVEGVYLDIARRVKDNVKIPVALKIDPFFSAFGNMARQFDEIGIDGLVMFNRMLQPDFNLTTMQVETSWPISKASDIGIPIRWISALHGKVNCSLAATTGTYDHEDIIKYLLAGADSVMLASSLIRNGSNYVSSLLQGIEIWMKQRGFENLKDIRGLLSLSAVDNPESFERANYIRTLDAVKNR